MLIPNHGLGYLATALRRAGHVVGIIDCIRDRLTYAGLVARVTELRPDIIGFQVYTFDLPSVRRHLDDLTLQGFNGPVLVGGPHPTADPAGTLELCPRADFLFVGEADHDLPKLVDVLEQEGFPRTLPASFTAHIDNLFCSSRSELAATRRNFITDLDSLGFPAWDLIPPSSYPIAPQGTFLRRIPFAPIIVTRGCPFQCTFCAGAIVSGRQIRSRSVEHVVEELKFLEKTYGIKEFHIQDDNFTFNRNFVLNFCETLHNSNLRLVWSCPNGVRLDTLDREVIRAMESSGCYSIAVGIEAGTQRVLNLMRKRLLLDEVHQRLALIRENSNILITGFFVLGHPGETAEEMRKTIALSRRLDLDKVNYGLLMPLPGTEVEQLLAVRGDLAAMDWTKMSEYGSPYVPPVLTIRQYRRLFQWGFFRFYARPRIIARFIREIQSWDQLRILFRRFKDVFATGDPQ